MNILLIGASGRTGQEVIKQAIKNGHYVKAFVRNPSKLKVTHANVHIIQGDVLDYYEVCQAMRGCDAVISCLGTENLGHSTLLVETTNLLIQCMKENGIQRIAYTASAGIDGEIPGMTGWLAQRILKNVLRDHHEAVKLLKVSGLDWTVARPMGLTSGPLTTYYRIGEASIPENGRNISRSDVAHFLLQALENNRHIKKSLSLSY
ncbi:NAD(P)-dependent oxidoreductase [Priestia megaterium]|uniref:NAD(P)-dependent oxidoreductase n=1 Tax=Priestia megaterium TaxID=1404 RepID=UPI002FFE2CC3